MQEIKGKECDGQLKIWNLQKIPFCPVIYSVAVHVFVPRVSFITTLLFIPFVYRIITGGMEQRGVWISAVNTPCVCAWGSSWNDNGSRGKVPWLQFVSLPPQMMNKCYRAARILISLDCCLMKQWGRRQECFSSDWRAISPIYWIILLTIICHFFFPKQKRLQSENTNFPHPLQIGRNCNFPYSPHLCINWRGVR